ncbi:primosomal protein N' [Candidatus Saccharibacteria bacterium]|nr:primosomal protein N' [Candidatus Saccharibacteria bacterium]
MYYFGIWVRSPRYRGQEALTYCHNQPLAIGQVVRVSLQRESVLGVVVSQTKQVSIPNIKAVETVYEHHRLPQELLELGRWLMAYYPTSTGVISQLLLPAHIPARSQQQPKQIATWQTPRLPDLTDEQLAAMKELKSGVSNLLHGRTGSGKTRLYQALAEESLQRGKSVLILSPEIGLTSQLVTQFEVFGKRTVVVLHSQLTSAERLVAWRTIVLATEPLIVIGPRSALFSPIRQLGLIVVDEAHDSAYKQDQPPHYHTNRVAAQLAREHHATLVYGTATPLVSEYYLAEQKSAPIIRLSQLATKSDHTTELTVVDLKNRDEFTKSGYLSDKLIHSVQTSLSHGEQSLLYLNRRGTARVALCQQCGWQASCPNCDLPLTYHGDHHLLQCHVCNFRMNVPTSCPECGNTDISFRSVGTKAVEVEIQRLFPDAKIRRFDSDNIKQDRLEQHFAALERGDVDIIVGTQAVAKGLDLPKLSTLGVIVADTSLYVPDYTANEQTYQLINQVVGRIRRGHRSSRAIIQTYAPEHPAIKLGLADEWQRFYTSELAERKLYQYPPYVSLLKIACRRKSASGAERACQRLAAAIEAIDPSVTVDGPAPALHERFHDAYQWQLVVKADKRSKLLAVLQKLPKISYTYDIDPTDLL